MDLGGPSSLSMISNCQRHLPEDKVAKCIQAIGLDKQSGEYFELIHLLARARTETDRKRIEEKIQICFGSGLFKEMIDEGNVFARQWYLSALREATALQSTSKVTDASVAALSEALGIPTAEVERGFQVLIERGLLSKTPEGRLERTDPSIHNFGRTNAFSMLNYNIRVLEQSIKAAVLSSDKRYFETLTVAIPKALFPEIKQRIKRFFREIDIMAEGSEGRTQVVQMNIQFFTQFDETTEN
jgi:uncharacterized protein (TIGR02147 family)